MPLIEIVGVGFDTFVCILIIETNNAILSPKYNIFDNWEYVFYFRIKPILAVCPSGYLRASYHVYKIGCCWCAAFPFSPRNCLWLPLRISFRGSVGNLTSNTANVAKQIRPCRGRSPAKSVASVCRAGARTQEGRDAAPRNGEDISAAKNLSNGALPNKLTPFFRVFCPAFDFVKRFSFWGHHHLHHHHRTDGRTGDFFGRQREKALLVKQEKPSSNLTKLGFTACETHMLFSA